MRPDSIRKFDLFYVSAMGISIASALLNFETLSATLQAELARRGAEGNADALVLSTVGIRVGVALLLWFLASRLRWTPACLLLLAYLILQVVVTIWTLVAGAGGEGMASNLSITGVIFILLQGIGLWFLFQPDAREWFASSGD